LKIVAGASLIQSHGVIIVAGAALIQSHSVIIVAGAASNQAQSATIVEVTFQVVSCLALARDMGGSREGAAAQF
jgi:hypothetical protein